MRLSIDGCRTRQRRLLLKLAESGPSMAVLTDPRHVLYLSGFETPPGQSSALILTEVGNCRLVAPVEEAGLAVDEIEVVEPSRLYTLCLDHSLQVAERVKSLIGQPKKPVGIDMGSGAACFGEIADEILDLSEILFDLRSRKDPDELFLMRQAIRVTEACYQRAREIIEPGVSELEVYCELYKTAVQVAGEKLPAMGNDFQCGSPGGAPRNRKARTGELYILDLGTEIGGYNADNARTFSVDGHPSSVQLAAWEEVVEVFKLVEQTVRPGVSCRELYEQVRVQLDPESTGRFFHHLGHGVGLSPHERPNLNPHWDHQFEVGNVFTVEPGIYAEELRAGIRLEENYVIVKGGVNKLTSFPLGL